MASSTSGSTKATLQCVAAQPDLFSDFLCMLDARLWVSCSVTCTRLHKFIVHQQTRQYLGRSLHFEKRHKHHVLLRPALLSHVDFSKVRCILFDEELRVFGESHQAAALAAQIIFVLLSAKDSLEVLRFSNCFLHVESLPGAVRKQFGAAIASLSTLRVLEISSELIGLPVPPWQCAVSPKRKFDVLWIWDDDTPPQEQHLNTVMGHLLNSCQQVGELGVRCYEQVRDSYPHVMESPSSKVDFITQLIKLNPLALRLNTECGIPVFPKAITQLLVGIKRITLQGLGCGVEDLPYFESQVSGQFPANSEIVFESCSFVAIETQEFVAFCLALRQHFRRVCFKRSCEFSTANAAAAFTLVHTRQLMNELGEIERSAFLGHVKDIISTDS